jgi:hypothetical protein
MTQNEVQTLACALAPRLLPKSHRNPQCSLPPSTPSKSPNPKRRPTSLMNQKTRRSYVMCFSLLHPQNLTEVRIYSLSPLPYPPNSKTQPAISYRLKISIKAVMIHRLNTHNITTQIDQQKIHNLRAVRNHLNIVLLGGYQNT